ncbi:glycine-rich domain-containing protein 1 [Cocos nucifera]|uniref:Glycine-rich domain-containing protein 1 n=1 Tax=Cocos nucifera TaxID=13894 RepID=A0A8K0HT46_COCNU|nr:glycine-rich domain-containing protein 1 [Cocos nucifera]
MNITPVSSCDSLASRSNYDSSGGSNSGRRGNPRLYLDLVTAGRWHLSFLRSFAGSPLLDNRTAIALSIRRYEELWMPLIADLSKAAAPSDAPMLLPPADVHWIWHCHCLHPESYREYCASRFGELIDRPAIFDEENEEYAFGRCREIWGLRYPSEPFDLEIVEDDEGGASGGGDLFAAVARCGSLDSRFSDPFVSETVYLVFAKRRYLNFLQISRRFEEEKGLRMVPTSDILLMWLTHQSFPGSYARDTEGMGDLGRRVMAFREAAAEEEAEATRRVWEEAFDEPYERAGAAIDPAASPSRVFLNWEAAEADVNRTYKGLHPRFLMEVCVFLKGKWQEKEVKNLDKKFLRLRTVRGIALELRQKESGCLRNSKLLKSLVFEWNDLLRATTLTLTREIEMPVTAMTSITPPVQAPYFLKCVPDRVTDDGGKMISDVILRMNRYRPQEGRWLSRTVLDHAGRECFVIRIRVGRGIWRRGAETPTAIKWEDRITEVREGPWKYVGGSVGTAPGKVVGTATPKKDNVQEKKATWCLSTGDVLTIQWEDRLEIQLENENSTESAKLLRGRKLQYQVKEVSPSDRQDDEEAPYLTLVRFTSEHPDGKATALLNMKLFAVEFLPEEDAVLVLLLCMAIIRTISEIRREDVGGLLLRRRVREVKAGTRDWGSVILPSSSSYLSPHLQPWYWNAEEVLASAEMHDGREPTSKYSPADGKDLLYKQAIIP